MKSHRVSNEFFLLLNQVPIKDDPDGLLTFHIMEPL
jgi:hypothetical protein